MKFRKSFVLITALLIVMPFCATIAQGLGLKLGSDIGNKNPNAVLDLGTGSKGLLLPRINLSSTINYSPLLGSSFGTAAPAGMAVYNSVNTGDVTSGFYYSDGTKWNKAQTSGNMLILGTGTTAGSTNSVILATATVTLPTASNSKGNVYIIRNTTPS